MFSIFAHFPFPIIYVMVNFVNGFLSFIIRAFTVGIFTSSEIAFRVDMTNATNETSDAVKLFARLPGAWARRDSAWALLVSVGNKPENLVSGVYLYVRAD